MTMEEIPDSHPDYKRIIAALNRGECPDCEAHTIKPGPRGAASRNLYCDNCGSRFNVAPWRDRPSQDFWFVQRID